MSGLADAGVALEHEPGQPAPGTLHESFDRREFGPAADDLVRHGKPCCLIGAWSGERSRPDGSDLIMGLATTR